MKWFKRKLAKWVNEYNNEPKPAREGMILSADSDSVSSDPILNFKVYSAVGGRIVEFRQYDRHKDRNFHQTYIITNDQDFGERISKIATMEILKQ